MLSLACCITCLCTVMFGPVRYIHGFIRKNREIIIDIWMEVITDTRSQGECKWTLGKQLFKADLTY